MFKRIMFSQTKIKSRLFANLARFCSTDHSYLAVINHLQCSPDVDVRKWASWLAPKAHCGVEASLTSMPDLFSPLDRVILSSAEHAGRLSEAFQYLSQYYFFLARAGGQLCYGLLIPTFLLFGGTIVLAIIQAVIAGGVHMCWMHCGPPIFALGLGVAGIFLLARWGIHGAARNISTDEFLRRIPVLGKAWQELTESRFALAFFFYIQAGMPVLTSLELSSKASRSALVQHGARQAIACIEKKKTSLIETLQQQRMWSPFLRDTLLAKKSTGLFDERAFQAACLLQQNATSHMEKICSQIPKLATFAIILLLLWKVFVLFSDLNIHYTAFLNSTF